MPRYGGSEFVGFDAERVLEAALDTVEGPLYSFVEFTFEEFNTLYVAEETVAMYADEEEMFDHFEQLHNYVNLDFTEKQLFTDDLLPVADEVQYKTTSMDVLKIVRFYVGEDGLFVAVDPDEPVVPLNRAVRDTIEGSAVPRDPDATS